MTNQVAPEEVHHLKGVREGSPFKNNVPWVVLIIFIVMAGISAIIHTYFFRDLPKCRDENIQILVNRELRNNEQLLNKAQTLAFGEFKEKSHSEVQRDCSAELLTNAGTYLIQYRVINNSGGQNFFQHLFSQVDYSIALESVNQIH